MKIAIRGLELRGAYGRKTNMDDWRSGKDFKIINGPYCSRADIEAIKNDGFSMLEFMEGGILVERIFLYESLSKLAELPGTFERLE